MTRTEYDIKMIWAETWVDVWGILQDIDFWPNIQTSKCFGWIVSQTGFCYMEYPYNPAFHGNWGKA